MCIRDRNREESDLQLEINPSFTPKDIEEIKSSYNDLGNLVIDIKFKSESAKKLKEITANNINKGMAIIVDKKIITMPVITSEIPDGKLQISGSFTVEELSLIHIYMCIRDSNNYPNRFIFSII